MSRVRVEADYYRVISWEWIVMSNDNDMAED